MDSKTLLDALVSEKLLSQEQGKKLLQESSLIRKPVEEVIYEQRLIPEEKLAAVKSKLIGIPFKSKVDVAALSDELLKVMPEETVRNYKIVPLQHTEDMLVVGMLYPDDTKAQEAAKFVAKQLRANVGAYLITQSVWEAALRRYSPYGSEVEAAVKSLNLDRFSAEAQRITSLEAGAKGAEEAPIVRIVASTLKEAVWQKASDIHIEPQRNRVRIRFRIDGDLHEVSTFPIEVHLPIISRVKVLSNLKIDETRIPQDGRFRAVVLGRDIDFRVATFPTPVGEKVAVRVLDPQIGLKGFEELGLGGASLQTLRSAAEKPYGMILITGPTGSGKTTTLYAIMQLLNKEDVNIVSLEDPVEYFMDGLNQSQVHPEIGYDFANGLRQILRQDPDVIMVGEIRDEETAGLAVHAALTGHIVLSTLHTNNAIGVIPRLTDMKVHSFLLPSSLNLMIAQRLVPRLCDHCKKSERASSEVEAIIKRDLDTLSEKAVKAHRARIKNWDGPYSVFHAQGCERCKDKGVSGRIALFEIFVMTPQLADIIGSGATERKLLEEAKRQGMITLRQDGILKALEGVIAVESVLKETVET